MRETKGQPSAIIYRVDGSGQIISNRRRDAPNGLCFSPDYSLLYVANTGAGREQKYGMWMAPSCAMGGICRIN